METAQIQPACAYNQTCMAHYLAETSKHTVKKDMAQTWTKLEETVYMCCEALHITCLVNSRSGESSYFRASNVGYTSFRLFTAVI